MDIRRTFCAVLEQAEGDRALAFGLCPRHARFLPSDGNASIQGDIMRSVASKQTNGKIKRLSAEELAELMVPATAKTPVEKEAALKRATTGLGATVRVTRDMYRPR